METATLKQFVIENVNPAAAPAAELRRLMPLAKRRGLSPTTGSLKQAVYKYRTHAAPPAGNGHGEHGGAEPAVRTVGTITTRDIISGQELLRDLSAARETLTTLAAAVLNAAEVVARLEADTIARCEKLERFAKEWL